MGNAESITFIQQEEFRKLSKKTELSLAQIERLHERFGPLDQEAKGFLEHQDLLSIRSLITNPLGEQFVQLLLETSDNERVSFGQFVRFLSTFTPISFMN